MREARSWIFLAIGVLLAVVTGMAVLGLTSVLGAVLAQRRLEARLAAA